jgi:hypothetical protein
MKRNWTILILLGVLGYLQAAVFYWRWGVIPHSLKVVCPLCPNIDSIGTDLQKFTYRTLSMGTTNAVLLIAAFWIISRVFRLTTLSRDLN